MKPVQDISGTVKKIKKERKKKNPKMQCETGSGQYRKFRFSKKNPKTQCETGSSYYREFNFSKKIQKSGVKPVPIAIGSVNLKKIRKPV